MMRLSWTTDRVRQRLRMMYASHLGPPLSGLRRDGTVMFHIGRSGSSVVADLVRRHPFVFWDGEVYQRHLNSLGLFEEGFHDARVPVSPVPEITSLAKRAGPLIYGFEVKFFHLDIFGIDLDEYVAGLGEAGIRKVIVLERKNYLAKIVSSVRAHGDGVYHQTNRTPEPTPDRHDTPVSLGGEVDIDYSTGSLLDYLESYERSFQELRRALRVAGLQVLELTFEDHVRADPVDAYRRICSHLGIPPLPLRPRLQRIGASSLDESITDYAEVREKLKSTPYEWMLPDPRLLDL